MRGTKEIYISILESLSWCKEIYESIGNDLGAYRTIMKRYIH
jgi:hypothetical protein